MVPIKSTCYEFVHLATHLLQFLHKVCVEPKEQKKHKIPKSSFVLTADFRPRRRASK
ncbi:hypothetical protein DPMN_194214, partial [Dreissena polymorpha]